MYALQLIQANNIALFINGTREATGSHAINKSASRIYFKYGSDIGGNDFEGYISNMRIVKDLMLTIQQHQA